ncbi:7-cyano-7-deazaguanine synthase QueC [Alteriqipengyuania lutimaris]|uniref:7-cyano-7-deazaguanine synthase n=1 Tax=Alteriqipengyuania lutimaris TaxID=1538146 RepID=A0A395LI10_9SPHN|nr:7-cyano-7-deazaguanine synthase QueC [Alteriqipengyuania lutimaris]MBB3034528.1 7-cyano-7-deazaguanine synthase [Alteriqipengyuania lutimaris]RDS76586.1 7-cyano-7-deazaguanine synthase QueC [Alteriqipengyuania lutimaris]
MPENSQEKAAVLLSGGLDSMVAAALAREKGHDVHALTIDYGQRHKRELEAARAIARALGLAGHSEIALDLRQFGGSALTADIDVPKDGVGETIPVTYVPARNLVFLALTTAFAESIGAGRIVIGVNALDYSGYPDCRPEFIAAFAEAARLGTKAGIEGQGFAIDAPLQFLSKADIAREADRLGLDTGLSWSCYDPRGDGLPCGLCDSCRLRMGGFAAAGLTDGLTYPPETE